MNHGLVKLHGNMRVDGTVRAVYSMKSLIIKC